MINTDLGFWGQIEFMGNLANYAVIVCGDNTCESQENRSKRLGYQSSILPGGVNDLAEIVTSGLNANIVVIGRSANAHS
jgi:hypothetical protein